MPRRTVHTPSRSTHAGEFLTGHCFSWIFQCPFNALFNALCPFHCLPMPFSLPFSLPLNALFTAFHGPFTALLTALYWPSAALLHCLALPVRCLPWTFQCPSPLPSIDTAVCAGTGPAGPTVGLVGVPGKTLPFCSVLPTATSWLRQCLGCPGEHLQEFAADPRYLRRLRWRGDLGETPPFALCVPRVLLPSG